MLKPKLNLINSLKCFSDDFVEFFGEKMFNFEPAHLSVTVGLDCSSLSEIENKLIKQGCNSIKNFKSRD